jgi:hypothetical protein
MCVCRHLSRQREWQLVVRTVARCLAQHKFNAVVHQALYELVHNWNNDQGLVRPANVSEALLPIATHHHAHRLHSLTSI